MANISGQGVSPLEPGSFNGKNQIADAGWLYDARGNVVQQKTGETFAYDAENRLVGYCPAGSTPASCATGVSGETIYWYDGNGRRVLTLSPVGSAMRTATQYIYDSAGNLWMEYSENQGPSVIPTPACTTCYLTTDHLGSTRVVTDQNGCAVYRQDYLPFGEAILSSPGNPRMNATGGGICNTNGYLAATSPTTLQFTGKERDSESGLDFFGARYFSGAQGRFTSPDEPFNFADPDSPQSWNLYSYVRNNPLVNVDPWGHDCVYTYGATQSDSSITVGIESGNCSSSAGTYVAGTIDTNSLALNNGTISYSYSPYSGADLGTGTLGLPANDFPGIQGQANYFGAQQIASTGPFVNALGATALVVVGGGMAAGALEGTAAAEGIVSQTARYLSKSAARNLAMRLATNAAQAAAAAKAVSKATSSSSVEVVKEGTDLVVRIFRAGAVDGYQELEYTIDQVGNKQLIQKAFNNAGSLIHYDPK